ncbi:MAG: hypothetical protein IMZ62_01675 [Chloroflexi bacterium]|nr:hypothetical protein [Chloroflexota bacterium]
MENGFALGEPRVIPCGPTTQYSFFFDLINRHFKGNWGGNKPLHRICSLVRKMGVRTLVMEDLQPVHEIQEENAAIEAFFGQPADTQAKRLSFFRSAGKDWRLLPEEDFLGYIVLLKHRRPGRKTIAHVLESVVRGPTVFLKHGGERAQAEVVSNYYLHCAREFTTTLGMPDCHRRLRLHGTFFCQQNGYTHVCAHAALRMAINSSPTLMPAQKLTNQMINDLLGVNHRTVRVDRGLSSQQIQDIVKKLGLRCQTADFTERPKVGYASFIYPIVESRLPVILWIEAPGVQHVVAVLGHTVNSDRWDPEARQGYGCLPMSQYISSAAWADHFVISDDNYGMNVTLPAEMIRNFVVPQFNPNLHAAMAIGILPSRVRVDGYLAEQGSALMAFRVLENTKPRPENKWLVYLKKMIRSALDAMDQGRSPLRTIVCRTLLVGREHYIKHLREVTDSSGRAIAEHEAGLLRTSLPKTFWLTEVSLPDLYMANKHKIADIVSTVNPSKAMIQAGQNTVFCWVPGLAIIWIGRQPLDFPWSLTGHVPLLRHHDGPPPALEW